MRHTHTTSLRRPPLTCQLLNHAVFRPTWPLLGGIVSAGRTDADHCNLTTYELANSRGGHFFQKSGQVDHEGSLFLQLRAAWPILQVKPDPSAQGYAAVCQAG